MYNTSTAIIKLMMAALNMNGQANDKQSIRVINNMSELLERERSCNEFRTQKFSLHRKLPKVIFKPIKTKNKSIGMEWTDGL